MSRLKQIEEELKSLQDKLDKHELYSVLNELEDVKAFMEEHVFAVWDFMSLLKALQQQLTCVSIPWKPVESSVTARFINEIVQGEETDVNENGVTKSHYEMYIDAMNEIGASTSQINSFIKQVTDIESIKTLLNEYNIAEETKNFVNFTFDVIKTRKPHIIAASFTFGREDIIPDMFLNIIKKAEIEEDKEFVKLSYYLHRHIELDGDEHGPLALQMIAELCGDDDEKWNEVSTYAKASILKRIELWDGISKKIKNPILA
ncbi:DUF3050 domain-containing protein [Tenacibaculum sp. M341]|uniref:DUF3050 domain-containing protein n=1 Tax=Tenacibaculum sp. M341 TaxID=2530339 RepID=UPI00104B91D9|nr:DUF3050 domain-containing protein [Tenacibaculum sp. M341]TCI94869.1 DUF3050 domain-containing protein [Tenacibaculum sp. M341]